ncbi:hypothetical protein ACFFWD_01865 [Bradyrhizobium erythrophlei]|uniref:hypothetical protein n=1 Tax=Bradyrhizobium erythrophlei TaxID=1437360 RepID=UPI0035EC6A26
MLLGDIIRDFSQEAKATEALLCCNDVSLLVRVGESAERYREAVGEYAAGAVRRFANLATSEDWLSLMNVIERAHDPGISCLAMMIKWSLKQDEAAVPVQSGCTCGGGGGCS